jgi:DNA invertase Pin-like site-specific DNA recombinase
MRMVCLSELESVITFVMMKRVAIYARSSPDCPFTADEQIKHLMTVAIERGWTVAHVFADRPTAVKKDQDRRSGELSLIEAIRSAAIDRVLVWSIDRIGKSLADLIRFIETCRSAYVAVTLHDEGFDSETSNGLSLFDVSALLANHLRQSRRDRILRGQAAARALSIRFGRPPIAKPKVEKAKQFLASGKGVRQVAKIAGISPASVSRIKTSMSAEATGI